MRPAAAFLPLLLLASACSRPPAGMRRLDSGDDNHAFRVDRALRRLYYLEGGGEFVTRLGVVDLADGSRESYRFPHLRIIGLRPSARRDAVKVAAVGTGADNEGVYELLLVDAATGRILDRETRPEPRSDDLARFGKSPEPPLEWEARAVGGRRPGVATTTREKDRLTTRFFPTPTPPLLAVRGPGDAAYAAYDALNGGWNIEELRADTGVRRPIARFPAEVESMAAVGRGLAVLRRARGGGSLRRLAMVDASSGRVSLELAWSDGDSEILAADTAKRLLYIRMNEGENESCWAVHFDEAALREASVYLARHRSPEVRKVTDTDILGLVMAAGLVVLLAGFAGAALRD